jgi:large subunit ribosomal protein L30
MREGEKRTIKLTLTGSPIGCTRRQRETLSGLGLTWRERTVIRMDSPATRGMVRKVAHLVRVEA